MDSAPRLPTPIPSLWLWGVHRDDSPAAVPPTKGYTKQRELLGESWGPQDGPVLGSMSWRPEAAVLGGSGVPCPSPLCARAASPEPGVTVLCVPDNRPPSVRDTAARPVALPPTSTQAHRGSLGTSIQFCGSQLSPRFQSRAVAWNIHL